MEPRHRKSHKFRVICAVDGKLPAKYALRWAVEVARVVQTRPKVCVLAAVEAFVEEAQELNKRDPRQLKRASLLAKEITDAAIESLGPERAPGVRLKPRGLAGTPIECIDLATSFAELFVVGHARSGLSRVLWGSFADDLIRHSNAPVLIVPLPDRGAHIKTDQDLPSVAPIASILCPTPLGPEGVALVARANFLVELLGASLRVVHVHSDGSAEAAQAGLAELSSKSPPVTGCRKVTYELHKAESVSEAILVMARDGVHLVIMGSHGRAGMEKARLGSTAEKVLTDIPCPIMIVSGEKAHPLTEDQIAKSHAQTLF
jgi:nucleotide-binding universal stress UspA family protein